MFRSSLILWLLIVTGAQATNYYADITNGNNANSGLTWALAKKNIQNAVDLATTAGDYVRVTNGWYPERVAVTANGTIAAPIWIIAMNHTNVACQGFNNTGDNIKIVGFEITHLTEVGYAAVDLITATNNLFDCMWIHSVDTGGNGSFQADRSHGLVLRNFTMAYSESAGTTNATTPLTANARSICLDRGPNERMLIEFGHIYQVGDYINPYGTNMIFQGLTMGPTTPDFASGAPHVDGGQFDGETHYAYFRNIFGATNAVHDGHGWLIQAPALGVRNGDIVVVQVVWIDNGDQLFFEITDGTNILASHLTVYRAGTGPGWGGPASSGFIRENDGPGDGNGKIINSVFTNVTTGSVFVLDGTGGASMFLYRSNNLAWSTASDFTDGVAGNKKSDPKFINATTGDFMLNSDSPAVDTGIHETWVTSASASGTSFVVDNSAWFTDGFGATWGSKIDVGDDTGLTVTAVNHTTHTVTVDRSITWAQNDGVGFAKRGSGFDMGGFEFGDVRLSAVVWQKSGTNIVVTATGQAAQCTAYTNWVPMQTIWGAGPYTFTNIASITDVKFIANPELPQYQRVYVATPGDEIQPAGGSGIFYQRNGKAGRTSGVLP